MQNTVFKDDGTRRVDTKVLHNIAALFHAVKPVQSNYIEDSAAMTATATHLPHHLQLKYKH
jgi:hypothetical protein